MDAGQFDRWTKVFAAGARGGGPCGPWRGRRSGSGWRAGARCQPRPSAPLVKAPGVTTGSCCLSIQVCCIRDHGSQQCCTKGAHVCDAAKGCLLACPSGQEKCGDYCCLKGEFCSTQAMACIAPLVCPDGRAQCGGACCQAGETCHPLTKTCLAAIRGCQRPLALVSPPQTPVNPTCPERTKNCGGVCVDLKIDAKNCGACGHACASGEKCVGGNAARFGFSALSAVRRRRTAARRARFANSITAARAIRSARCATRGVFGRVCVCSSRRRTTSLWARAATCAIPATRQNATTILSCRA